jgi:hypothetical protein
MGTNSMNRLRSWKKHVPGFVVGVCTILSVDLIYGVKDFVVANVHFEFITREEARFLKQQPTETSGLTIRVVDDRLASWDWRNRL